MNDTYTYEDWNSGKVCLELPYIINVVEKSNPLRVEWGQIKESDIPIIKQKRKDLFEISVLLMFNKLKNQFEDDVQTTKSLNYLFDRLISKYEEILFGKISALEEYVTLKIDNTVFEYNHFVDIKNYATNHILLSKDIEYDFVHSSNCRLQSPEKFSAETEAEAYYRFLVWLKEEKSIRKNKKNQVNKITWRDVFIDEEHYTKALEIFDIVIDKNSKISSHAFVFHILRKNLYLKDIKHKV